MKRARIDCCYKCEDRHMGCHSDCKKYNQQKKEHEDYLVCDRKMKEYSSSVLSVYGKKSATKRISRH